MALRAIEWEALTPVEQLALAKAGEASPLAFCSLWFNLTQGDSFRTNWHHHYFNWAALRLFSGESQNIVINIPPGGTKTEFWSVHLPVCAMISFPRVRILNTSYSKDLVNENSERSRALVKSSEFKQFYDYQVGMDKVDNWTLERNGKRKHQLFSRSSGGQITGVRGGFMGAGYSGHVQLDDWDKIDDLFSEAKRKKAHTRLVNTLRSRKAHSGTPIVAIQQRGHVDDSTAFLLSGGVGLKVDLHVKIPALIDQAYIDTLPDGIRERCIKSICHTEQVDGYWSYWPEKEDVNDLMALRRANPYTFGSQYMQDPDELSGGIFFPDDFVYYGDVDAYEGEQGPELPDPGQFEYRIITVDTAQKTNEWNDWTVFAEWGVFESRIYRLAFQRERMEATQLREDFEKFVRSAWRRNGSRGVLRKVYVEDKSSGTGLIQEVKGRLPVPVTPVPRAKDKFTRSMDVQAFHHDKRVVLPYGDKHNSEFVAEVASFTHNDSHKFDDQTDVMIDALAYTMVIPEYEAPTLIVGY
jgi:predicted phage terminase large subunit-like protein